MGDQDKPAKLPIPGLQDLLDQHDVQIARGKSTDSQSRVRRDDAELNALGAGTDPDYVRTEERFEGMTLEAMIAAVHGGADGSGGLNAAGLQTIRKTWFDCYSDLVNQSTFNLVGMNRIFGNGLWQGASGSAAQTASEQYSRVANQIGRVFESMSQRLDSLAWAAEAVRIAVPTTSPSVTVVPNPDNPVESILPGLINPAYQDQVDNTREHARQAAIRALNSVYKETFPPAGTGVPTYAVVPQTVHNGDPGIPNGINYGSPVPAGTGPNDAGKPPGDDTPAPAEGSAPENSAAPTEQPLATTRPASTSPGDTSPASARTPDGTSSATTTPASVTNTPGSPVTPGLTGPGRVPNTNTGPGTPQRTGGPGASVPAVPGTGRVPGSGIPAAATAAGRPGAGRPGTSMGPGSGAGGRRKDGEDESEHYAPDYLRGVASDWTEGLAASVDVIGAGPLTEADPHTNYAPPPSVPPRQPAPIVAEPIDPQPRNPADNNAPANTTLSLPAQAHTVPTSAAAAAAPASINSQTEPNSPEPVERPDTGPSLQDLFAEYGWNVNDSPATPGTADANAKEARPEGDTDTLRSNGTT
ncbi:hypothetical protein [Nocardia sp. NPDC057030]|uniref:hypothetical protein n=1 Tax=unclassified Nocardia TaxID=2637762 RepID=UPI00362DAF1D